MRAVLSPSCPDLFGTSTSLSVRVARYGLAAVASCLLLTCGLAAAEPLKLRVGWAQAPSQLTPLAAELARRRPELFPGLGRSYTLEPLFFQGSTPQIQALAGGELEIASLDRKSTRLNSSHQIISYAVFCLKKKKKTTSQPIKRLRRHSQHTRIDT